MRRHGELHRWAGHLADDVDWVMVDRLAAGVRPDGYTAWERREAVRQLRRVGMAQREIAARIGVDKRQVCRDLERLGMYNTGWQRARYAAAASRRVITGRLYRAGLRPIEVVSLLGVSYSIAVMDRAALGLPSTGYNWSPPRPRDELLATYGHLLHDIEAGVA